MSSETQPRDLAGGAVDRSATPHRCHIVNNCCYPGDAAAITVFTMGTMEYNRVAHFVRVVRAGSFTAAAAELGLPKSSLSRSVTNLERDLGVRLLHRTTRKLALTDLGASYYESVRPAVESLDDAHERALEHDTQPRGVVRITAHGQCTVEGAVSPAPVALDAGVACD